MKVGDTEKTTKGRYVLNTFLIPRMANLMSNGTEVLFVGTDTGVSHLASVVGCNMLLFRKINSSTNRLNTMKSTNRKKTEIISRQIAVHIKN